MARTLSSYSTLWIFETWQPRHGWLAFACNFGLDTINGQRTIHNQAEDRALLSQFVIDAIHHVAGPRLQAPLHNRWPSSLSSHAQASLAEGGVCDPELGVRLNRIAYAALGRGCLGKQATWPDPKALDRFVARLQAFAQRTDRPHLLRLQGAPSSLSAHERVREAHTYASLAPMTASNTRLLLHWKEP